MNLRDTALLAAVLLSAVPVIAGYVRHRSGPVWWCTLGVSLGTAAFLAVLWRLLVLERSAEANPLIWALLLLGVPLLWGGTLFTGLIGRDQPRVALRRMRWPLAFLLAAGALALAAATGRGFVTSYRWHQGTGIIELGPFGKAYCVYLLVGAALVGQNLERAYRAARRDARPGFHPMLLGHFGILGFAAYVITAALLGGRLELDTVVPVVVPLAVADLLTGYGFVRGSLLDRAVPVSRDVVYASFTATVAALYFIAIGVAAELVSLTGWAPGGVVATSFVFFVLLVAALFFFSDRVRERVRRYVDLNFYVHRHDYRSHWARLTRELEPSRGTETLLAAAEEHLRHVFQADAVTLALRDKASRTFRARQGKGKGTEGGVLAEDAELVRALREEGRPILFDGKGAPPVPVDPAWMRDTACQTAAPLMAGDELVGVIGLERRDHRDPFTPEDLELLAYTAGQLGAVLRGAEWGQELAAMRETELLSQWSGMVVHDLKNHLSPLRMIVRNMRTRLDNPDYLREAVDDLAAVSAQMERLIARLGELRGGGMLARNAVDLSELARGVLRDLGTASHPSLVVETSFEEVVVPGDAAMIRRVAENLITNAVEAMDGNGTLRITVSREGGGGKGTAAVLAVRDGGPGMDETFVRERLFRPFATTKKGGLGLGLYQCRLILEAHGGEIQVDSRPGVGTVMKAVFPEVLDADGSRGEPVPLGTGTRGGER